MAEPIGALRVDLTANAAQFEKDMGRARAAVGKSSRDMSKSLGGFQVSVASTLKSIFSLRNALIAVAGVTAIGLLIKRNVEAADAIAKTADRIGLSTEAFQELQHAAEITGVEMELFNTAMTALVRRQGEAVKGNKEFGKGFETLGVSIEDLKTLKPEDLLGRVADGMRNLGNQSEQIAALDRVMSEAGRRMFNFANLGSEGLARLRQEARDLGLVLGEDMVREAERANDELTRMFNVLQTQLTRVVISLSPEIVRLGEAFAGVVPEIIKFANQFVPDKFLPTETLRAKIDEVEAELKRITGLSEVSFDKVLSGDIAENLSFITDDKIRDGLIRLVTEYKNLNAILDERIRKEALLKTALTDTGDANQLAANKIREIAGGLQFEIDQLGRTKSEQELYNLAKQKGVEVNDQFRASLLPLIEQMQFLEQMHKAIEKAAESETKKREDLATRGVQLTKELRNEQEIYNDSVAELNTLYAAGELSAEAYARGLDKAKKTLDDTSEATKKNKELARDLGLTFTSAFEDAVVSGGKLSDVLRGIEKDLIRIATRKLVTEPFLKAAEGFDIGKFLGFGGGGGQAAADLAGGSALFTPFAAGGMHTGGFRMVGEQGPEIEATGPARYYSAGRTADLLNGDGGPSGGNVAVNVYAPPGSNVETRESKTPGGRSIDVIIDEAVAQNINTPGSRTGRALRQNFGTNRQLTPRG